MKIRNTFIIFLVSGFWHGANWTFVIWGLLHALFFLPLLISNKNRTHTGDIAEGRILPSLKESGQITITFFMTLIAWIFFRADSINDAIQYIIRMISPQLFSLPEVNAKNIMGFIIGFIIIGITGPFVCGARTITVSELLRPVDESFV